ncbi:hypothetical protein RFI_09328 [Reticulomyxa filosa]|uniref:Uncharacterized protein n=1 Tax=Reticulomyxa filosa TaxID=46433 RepID=X6NND9_RETFI|nr:hypothetical protein RFI_09328 [Reticulomyxa filosa]|eukprot:ETO27805.1 hypothetical protein RFI_09328 [Reticulomyxa filosa]
MSFGWFFKNSEEKKEQDAHEQITRMLGRNYTRRHTLAVLLLGKRGSGKSSLKKKIVNDFQAETLQDGDISETELQITTMAIRKQVIDDMIDLCQFNKLLFKESCQIENKKYCEIRDRFASRSETNLSEEIELTSDMAQDIKLLWSLNEMKQTWKTRSRSHIMDNTPYFFEKVDKIADPDFCADFDDHVIAHILSSYVIKPIIYVYMCDCDWTKRWIRLFVDANIIFFITDLNGYDTNSLGESLELFDFICSLKGFDDSNFVVLLNKYGYQYNMIYPFLNLFF